MKVVRGALLCATLATAGMVDSALAQHGLTLDDLLRLSKISSTAISPDGEWIAAVVQRPALPGEMYGRTFYEMDATRSDVWLISQRTGEKRNLTPGAKKDGAGYWCATWSPDGRRLAMLSTQPAGSEPRGGDNVRLYVWERGKGGLKRLSSRAVMTQTMGGSPLYKVDLQERTGSQAGTARCSNEENAPFIWLDNTSLLTVTLPEGSTSGSLDAYSHALKHAAGTLDKLRQGKEPTVSAVDSGIPTPSTYTASLQKVDVTRARSQELGIVPIHPFDGNFQLSVSPDGRSAAVLAGTGAIPHAGGQRFAYPYSAWATEKKLGFVDLTSGGAVQWLTRVPEDARYILDLLSWSPDGSAVAVRGRTKPTVRSQTLFVVSARDLKVTRMSPKGVSVNASSAGADIPFGSGVHWTQEGGLILRAIKAEDELSPSEWYRQMRHGGGPRVDWWLFTRDAEPVNLTANMQKVPTTFRASPLEGQLVGVTKEALWSLDVRSRATTQLTSQPLPEGAEVIWAPERNTAPNTAAEWIIASREVDGVRSLVRAVVKDGAATVTPVALPGAAAEFVGYAPEASLMLFEDQALNGTYLWATAASGDNGRKLLTFNQHMAEVKLGEERLIEYRGIEGDALKAGVILPPDYQPGQKYPTLLWVYAGQMVRDKGYDYFGAYKPGMYNMQMYAARGYVILMPSMPLKSDDAKNDDYIELPKGVMPAVDRLIDMGIADPARLAVMGQSYGGYSTYSLVTYTNRFKAAIAMAGIVDLVSLYGQFDPTARGYPGIEHQKSVNWGLSEQGQVSMGGPPQDDLWRYLRNSPLYFADRVQTPLLLIHGEQDIRGPMSQAEEFFYALYRQGKRARLLRYWGDDHGLRQSPANVRDIVDEIFKWLETNLRPSA